MIFKTLNMTESRKAMEEWIHLVPKLPHIEEQYLELRNTLVAIDEEVRAQYSKDYDIDLNFGLKLYAYLKNVKGFNLRFAANDDFWRYLSLKVVPDLVSKRWGKENKSHFYERASRIWLRSLWWYIHLSWQGDEESTYEILKDNTTDEILNLVERAGRKGYYIDVYRNIMYFYSKAKNKGNRQLFRKVMVLNTARCTVMEPALCLGGEREYVKSIFRDLGERV